VLWAGLVLLVGVAGIAACSDLWIGLRLVGVRLVIGVRLIGVRLGRAGCCGCVRMWWGKMV